MNENAPGTHVCDAELLETVVFHGVVLVEVDDVVRDLGSGRRHHCVSVTRKHKEAA